MKNLKTVVSALLLFAILAGIGYALAPPPPPPPPVNQSLYIYDTSISFFKTNATDQSACRVCHTSSGTNAPGYTNGSVGGVPTRHHNLLPAGVKNPYTNAPFGCPDCHPSTPGIGNGILLDRSCTDCHNATNFWADAALGARVGNLSRPHHFNTSSDLASIGNPVAARQCKVCHGGAVDNYNDGHYVPSYDTDLMITPLASWKATSNVPLTQTLFDSGGQATNKTWGGCESCHLGQVIGTRQTINGVTVTVYPPTTGSPLLTNHDSHHQTILDGNVSVNGVISNLGGRTPGAVCSWCHVINPTSTLHGGVNLYNFTNPFTGELVIDAVDVRNSTINATSALEPGTVNITINGTGCEKCHSVATLHNIQFNYVQNGQQGLGHINNNSDCSGCHDEWVPQTTFVAGALVPSLDSVNPSVIAAGTATTLTLTGYNFVNDETSLGGGYYTSVVSIDGVQYTPTSITDSQIVVTSPALTAGVHQLQVVKAGSTLSKLSTLTAVPTVTITSAKLNKGVITITGTGFGDKPSNAQYYVSVTHAGNQIVSTAITSWSKTQIKAKNSAAATGDVVTVITANSGETTATIK